MDRSRRRRTLRVTRAPGRHGETAVESGSRRLHLLRSTRTPEVTAAMLMLYSLLLLSPDTTAALTLTGSSRVFKASSHKGVASAGLTTSCEPFWTLPSDADLHSELRARLRPGKQHRGRRKTVTTTMSSSGVAPNMLLRPTKLSIQALATADGRSSGLRRDRNTVDSRATPPEEKDGSYRYRRRGVLGFQLDNHEEDDDDVAPTNKMNKRPSALFSSRRASNVDSSLWNLPDNWNEKRRDRIILTAGAAASQSSPHKNSIIWFPWVPTLTQIESLKMDELQQVCAERGLQHSGGLYDLRDRLWEWTKEQKRIALRQRETYRLKGINSFDMGNFEIPTQVRPKDTSPDKKEKKNDSVPPLEANSLAEWSRTVDLEPLLHRRKAIHHEKVHGKRLRKAKRSKKEPNLSDLTKAFLREPKSNNIQVKELYAEAKSADKRGDRELAKALLVQLKDTTPNDCRIYRRLARMEKEEGNLSAARAVLQEGLRIHPGNAFLLHGLGQIARTDHDAKKCYRHAIQADPTFPHPYHALGTMEHTQGRIAVAMKVLKKGIEYSPTNHRLHHALGDLYRDAKMLDMAEKCYRKALKHGPVVSHGFAYNALAFVAYEQGEPGGCRSWLRKATGLNDGRHANAWVSLAQMEESEGNVDAARSACITGIAQYERRLLERSRGITLRKRDIQLSSTDDPVMLKNKLLKRVPSYRSGDRFFNVYRTWARLEDRYGTVATTEEVYGRAVSAFPRSWRLLADWAMYYARRGLHERAWQVFSDACSNVVHRHATPFRLFAEFEMSLGNYKEARKILYRGAMTMARSEDVALGSHCGLAELFHSWAVCEWHLGNLSRAGTLFDNALRVTNAGEEGSRLRSLILYSIARLEYAQGEYLLAQHCIGLCLKENVMPGGSSKIWTLWANVAMAMGNEKLAEECDVHAERALSLEDENGSSDLSQAFASGLARMKGRDMEQLMRRDPWYHKIFRSSVQTSDLLDGVELPDVEEVFRPL